MAPLRRAAPINQPGSPLPHGQRGCRRPGWTGAGGPTQPPTCALNSWNLLPSRRRASTARTSKGCLGSAGMTPAGPGRREGRNGLVPAQARGHDELATKRVKRQQLHGRCRAKTMEAASAGGRQQNIDSKALQSCTASCCQLCRPAGLLGRPRAGPWATGDALAKESYESHPAARLASTAAPPRLSGCCPAGPLLPPLRSPPPAPAAVVPRAPLPPGVTAG